jgi:carboxylesterase
MAANPSPFTLIGGDVGILLVHGFTGSPAELRPLGQYLNERGLTVAAPLLPGHGTTPQDANRARWQDWQTCVEGALAELQTRSRRVFVAGLSLGSLLSLSLAARHHELDGAIAYSPAIQVTDPRSYAVAIIKHIVPTLAKPSDFFADPAAKDLMWSYELYPAAAAHEAMKLIGEVKRSLPQITCPLLVFYSKADAIIRPQGAQLILDRVKSTDKRIVTLQRSGHVITVDIEWQQVAEETHRFVQQII